MLLLRSAAHVISNYSLIGFFCMWMETAAAAARARSGAMFAPRASHLVEEVGNRVSGRCGLLSRELVFARMVHHGRAEDDAAAHSRSRTRDLRPGAPPGRAELRAARRL